MLIGYADAGDSHKYHASFEGTIYKVLGTAAPQNVFEFSNICVQCELGLLTFELDTGLVNNGIIWIYHTAQEAINRGNQQYTILLSLLAS